MLVLALLLAACAPEAPPPVTDTDPGAAETTHVGSEACAQCHPAQLDQWRDSHHGLAMQEATPDTVLADFDDTRFRYGDVESVFARRDGRFFVTTDGPQGELVEYPIAYAFGVEPLQQYLIEFPDGRLQALNIVWDTRPAAAGGQRWYHLYPDETLTHDDPLHWTGPMHNWNFMCAECHSTGLEKNYSATSDSFDTSWKEIDVSCEACHGPGSAHVAWAEAPNTEERSIVSLRPDTPAAWTMNADTGIAQRQTPATSSAALETCARCHARRSIFSEDYSHGAPLMNTHRPALLDEGLYFADGQILEEVYVYGSFLQSKMHGAGVTCTDCHNPHNVALVADGNAVCGQCHSPAVFDTPAHHRHEPGSAGAQCVECHMPSRVYMGVDARRDHSFRVPRPDLTVDIGTPNACNGCHDDQTPSWADAAVADWHGTGRADTEHYGEIIDAGRRGLAGAPARLIALADDAKAPAIVRATAVSLLAANPTSRVPDAIARAARARDGLVRMAAAQSAQILGPGPRLQLLTPLLDDPLRAVRLQAVGSLLPLPREEMSPPQRRAFDRALTEYTDAQILNADRAEGQANLGAVHAARGNLAAAVAAYRRATQILPQFTAAHVNMAELYRQGGQEDSAQTLLRQGLDAAPGSAELHHALGLSLVRQGRYDDAMVELEQAVQRAPDDARFAYVLGVALNSGGDSARALEVLDAAHQRRPGDRELLFALATIARDAGRTDEAIAYAERLVALDENDPATAPLLDSLRGPATP